jgi:hypothetical protein
MRKFAQIHLESVVIVKVFLNVPYEDRISARIQGAKWSPGNHKWYVEDVENLEPFLQWMPEYLKEAHKAKPRTSCN